MFHLSGGMTGWQILGWVMVFAGLIIMNEIARRSKAGGAVCFFVIPAALTVYFISIYVGAAQVFPFVIVAINILIAVVSDFESAVRAGSIMGGWWKSSEGVWLYGGWWNILNGIAGLINIFCMTGWWGIYSSKDKKDMLWPDMIWYYILAYDIWNFQYTYLNLPTHAWYCGFALLLAPTVANALWNKGGWIQNRANTLALWCMFAQVFPLFQDGSRSLR